MLLFTACTSAKVSDRPSELAACQLISKSGDDLARCLVLKYSWRAESAGPAKYVFQRQLDSIEREHEVQAALVLAQEQRREDSIRAVQDARRRRLDLIDSTFWACYNDYVTAAIKTGNEARRDSGRTRCLQLRTSALRRAGFAANALPNPDSSQSLK